jgi:hypothetical protein
MLISVKGYADFSAGCTVRRIGHLLFATRPHQAAIRELTHASLTTAAQHFEGW